MMAPSAVVDTKPNIVKAATGAIETSPNTKRPHSVSTRFMTAGSLRMVSGVAAVMRSLLQSCLSRDDNLLLRKITRFLTGSPLPDFTETVCRMRGGGFRPLPENERLCRRIPALAHVRIKARD